VLRKILFAFVFIVCGNKCAEVEAEAEAGEKSVGSSAAVVTGN